MFDILAHIVAFIWCAVWILGLIGLFVYIFKIIASAFTDKGMGPLPWWVFWRH